MSVLKDSAPAPPAEEPDYGVESTDASVAALGLDVRLVALVHAKVCLHAVLGEQEALAGNVVLFGTARVDGLFPRAFASAVADVSPQDDCLICRPLRDLVAA
jgi:hypothetical protein